MATDIILKVDDDAAVSQAITRELRARYADRYRIVRASSAPKPTSSPHISRGFPTTLR